jgi:hypothetical protein
MKSLILRLALATSLASATFAASGESAITVYKTSNCGCCVEWVEYLRAEGFTVTAVDRADLQKLKRALGVEPARASCHTAIVDGYVIEGHVPAGPIRRLLSERPQTLGLTVPSKACLTPGTDVSLR